MGRLCDIPNARVEYFLSHYKPRLTTLPSSFTVGRVKLDRNETQSKQLLQRAGSFSHTKHALRLMETIATCVSLNEPVLLVGETGNGKTAVIQHLACQVGTKLLVQNLNQQSDSSDLLGGYKPVEVRQVCVPLMNTFGRIFPKTFSRTANAQFLQKIKKSFDEKKWTSLVAQFRRSIKLAEEKLSAKAAQASSLSSTTTALALASDAMIIQTELDDEMKTPVPSLSMSPSPTSSAGITSPSAVQANAYSGSKRKLEETMLMV